jgi:hypothetical protein
MVEKTDGGEMATLEDKPLKTITKDVLLKLRRVPRKLPTEAQARIVRGGGKTPPATSGGR